MQQQTGENTQDLSSTTDLRDGTIMEIQLEITFSNAVRKAHTSGENRKAHTSGEKKNSAPSTTKLSSQIPCLSMPRRICAHEIVQVASERRNQPLTKCESPTKYLILDRKDQCSLLQGAKTERDSKRKSALTLDIPDLINSRLVLPNKRNHCQPCTGGCSHLHPEPPPSSKRTDSKDPQVFTISHKPYYSNSYLQNEYTFMLILGK